jgi:DNA-directed RNA polymerase III subunit RPC6
MRYDLEPSREITGGTWYIGSELDSEFINILSEQVFEIINKKVIPFFFFIFLNDNHGSHQFEMMILEWILF